MAQTSRKPTPTKPPLKRDSVPAKPRKAVGRNAAAIKLLQQWIAQDAASDSDGLEEWERLKRSIEANRLSKRKRFAR